MLRARAAIVLLTIAGILVGPSPVLAWNATGHRLTAEIAYRSLDPATRQKVAELLRAHPVSTDFWANRPENPSDPDLALFHNAAIFPDDARRPVYRDLYDRPTEHYVNYRLFPDPSQVEFGNGLRAEPPLPGTNLLNSYRKGLGEAGNVAAPPADRAVALTWIFHQVGDIHQPLHAVARFGEATPEGDRGGNSVKLQLDGRETNLHSYWDGLAGRDDSPAAVSALADRLMSAYPESAFSQELTRTDVDDWARESVDLARSTVYPGFSPDRALFDSLPEGYAERAHQVADRRLALAGYRLAAALRNLVNDQPGAATTTPPTPAEPPALPPPTAPPKTVPVPSAQ